jgi:UDP-glucose 4-epimerase
LKDKILVTGGAGYIGSHVVKLLNEAKYDFLVLDNLSTGRRDSVLGGDFILGDISDSELLDSIFQKNKINGIIHFAGSIVVPESVREPLKYYKNNTENSRILLEKAIQYGVENFIFSSTAAVYGEGVNRPILETDPANPINPYGRSKLMFEWVLEDVARANPKFKYICLRYFNVAGADPDKKIGQCSPVVTHLIKRAVLASLSKIEKLELFGTDYDTPDGTCVRDFIHVTDLSQAHLDALNYLFKNRNSHILNCGYGKGHSVKEVINEVKKISGVNFRVEPVGRREGDPPSLVSNPSKIKEILGWKPKYDSLHTMVKSAYDWEKILQKI